MVIDQGFKLSTGTPDGAAHDWWAHFLVENIFSPNETLQDTLNRFNSKASCELIERIGDDLIFETEEDALLFVMKWSGNVNGH